MGGDVAEPVDAGGFQSARWGSRPLVTARVMRAWRFSASRSRSARFFSINPSIRAVFSSEKPRNPPLGVERWNGPFPGKLFKVEYLSMGSLVDGIRVADWTMELKQRCQ